MKSALKVELLEIKSSLLQIETKLYRNESESADLIQLKSR